MEATPSGISHDIVKNTFLNVEGIKQVHNLRIWSLTTDKTALSAHLVIEKGLGAQKVTLFNYKSKATTFFIQVLQEATQRIRSMYEFYEMTLQVEEFQNDMMACDQCKTPAE